MAANINLTIEGVLFLASSTVIKRGTISSAFPHVPYKEEEKLEEVHLTLNKSFSGTCTGSFWVCSSAK